MLTTFGVKENGHYLSAAQNQLKMGVLFEKMWFFENFCEDVRIRCEYVANTLRIRCEYVANTLRIR